MVFNFGWAPQLFGARRNGSRRHAGIDLGTGGRKNVPLGCPISGFKVKSVSYRRGYGNTVDLISEDGTKMMRFAHLAALPKHLTVGDSVQQGDWLGNVGNSGGNYAIHLHFEYRTLQNGSFVPVNPFNNQFHTFSKQDFEQSTKLAYRSRECINSGMTLQETQNATGTNILGTQNNQPALASISNPIIQLNSNTQMPPIAMHATQYLTNTNQPVLLAMPPVWTLEKSFEEPTVWERYMPEFLGGWPQHKVEEADIQKKLDEEVFKGIKRKEMLSAGMTNQDIDLLRQFVDDQIQEKGLEYRLNTASVPVNFDDVFQDSNTAAIAKQFFINNQNNSSGMG